MSRTDELEQCERRLRELVSCRDESAPATPPEAHLEESVVGELAYAQMQLERHLAETRADDRENEQFRLELAMPTFTSLRLWYNVTRPQAQPPEE
jgi:hypothetical protein